MAAPIGALGQTGASTLHRLQAQLGHQFSNLALLQTALTHASFVNEAADAADAAETYERLEFVGDAVLGLVCAQLLYAALPGAQEGELSRRRARVVRQQTLAQLARDLDLEALVRVGHGHRRGDAGLGDSILADVFEAVMGAVYLDGGLAAVLGGFARRLSAAIQQTHLPQDFKTRLQELAHTQSLGAPLYVVEKVAGPAHARSFHCAVRLKQTVYGRGLGSSKKLAEQICAQAALLALGTGRDDP